MNDRDAIRILSKLRESAPPGVRKAIEVSLGWRAEIEFLNGQVRSLAGLYLAGKHRRAS